MAIQNARILMRGGNEADFDPDKMQPKEWAVSLDQRIVRICVAPGVCIRMATYDAFEADMAQIEAILEQTKSIQEAVTLINEQVSVNAEAVAEYTEEAKQYRDEAEQFRNEAEAFSPTELKAQVEKNTVKIDTILEKGGLTFDESASGENIHLTDTTDNKATAFALYGKATQESTTGASLMDFSTSPDSANSMDITFENDVLTLSDTEDKVWGHVLYDITELYKNNAGKNLFFNYESMKKTNGNAAFNVHILVTEGTSVQKLLVDNNGVKSYHAIPADTSNVTKAVFRIYTNYSNNSLSNTLTLNKPMLYFGTEEIPYETFTGRKPSPSPDYPQEIEVAGASGSVEVKSVGKNVIGYENLQNKNEVVYENDVYTITQVPTTSDKLWQGVFKKNTQYTFSGSHKQGTERETVNLLRVVYTDGTFKNMPVANTTTYSDFTFISEVGKTIDYIRNLHQGGVLIVKDFQCEVGAVATPYQPYKETTATIPTPNGLPGIPVSSGGNYTDENGQQWICDSIVKYADGTGKYVQRIYKKVFAGTESLALNSASTGGGYYFLVADTKAKSTNSNSSVPNAFNTRLPLVTANNLWGKDINGITIKSTEDTSAYSIRFRIPSLDISTVNDMKAKLAEWYSNGEPMVLMCELAEPIITDLSAEEIAEIEKLQTFYPVTNISNDAGCGMEIAYKADAKNYIDNIILARVATLETAVINNL